MSRLVCADVRRIFNKRSLLGVLIISGILALISALWADAQFRSGFSFAMRQSTYTETVQNMILGVWIFVSVYGDEHSSKSMQSAIGRGISRSGIVFAKIIDAFIISFFMYLFLLVWLFIVALISNAGMNEVETMYLISSVLKGAYEVSCTSAMAGVIMYATENFPFSLFGYIFLQQIAPLLMIFLGETKLLYKLHPQRCYISGFANRGFSEFILTGGGYGILIFGLLIYVGGAFLLSTLIMNKKELEF